VFAFDEPIISSMPILLGIWVAVGFGLIACQPRQGSAGLPLAYFLGLSLIHVPGALLYFDSAETDSLAIVSKSGFEQTITGMVAFLIGVLVARYTISRTPVIAPDVKRAPAGLLSNIARSDRISKLYIVLGFFVSFGVMRFAGGIPSVAAILSSLGSLMIVGICLRIWVAREEHKPTKAWSALALALLLPLGTTVQGGFIGFGTYWLLVICCFFFARSNHRIRYILAAPVVAFVGLSIFVNYAAARDDFRRLVWVEQVGIGDRFARIAQMIEQFEWLDLSKYEHRRAIDLRLNQNSFVGLAVERLRSKQVDYALGSTPGNIVLALIPRVLWPDKPVVGGGGTIVADFTGLKLAEGTSFGAGQVLEFFANFGAVGVIVGFFLYGMCFGHLDFRVSKHLQTGDQRRLLLSFLVSLSLLQPGGNLLEITVSVVTSILVAYGLGGLLRQYWRRGVLVRSSAD